MHARYYKAHMGRFLTVDPILGSSAAPQSWNRYSYARNNPTNLVDPTGLYVVNCAEGDSECAANASSFEEARQSLLEDSDERLRAAAAALGDPGVANGVVLTFGDPGNGAGARVDLSIAANSDNTAMLLSANLIVRPGISGTELRAAVGHEGSHTEDGFAFAASFDLAKTWWDLSKNPTERETETKAYRLTHLVYEKAGEKFDPGCSKCTLGRGVKSEADLLLRINRILANPNLYDLQKGENGGRLIAWDAEPPGP